MIYIPRMPVEPKEPLLLYQSHKLKIGIRYRQKTNLLICSRGNTIF
jgi:hypothetical protein